MASREVLICLRVDEAVVPPVPSFNCQCEVCGARIWVPHNSPLEPARMCGACGTPWIPKQGPNEKKAR
jgi:hypothetical protein